MATIQPVPADVAKALKVISTYLVGESDLDERSQKDRKRFSELLEELRSERKRYAECMLAFVKNEFVPLPVFKPWCSYAQLRTWNIEEPGCVKWELINGRYCIRPSDFFEVFNRKGRKP